MIHPGPVSPSACVFIPYTPPPPLNFPPAALLLGPPSAWHRRYPGTVGTDRLQMSSRHVVTWHLEQIPGGVGSELIDYTPRHKVLLHK